VLLHSGSGQYNRFRESLHVWYEKGNIFSKQFLWYDTIDMLGGKIIGEGVDGCVLTEPMWPCASSAMKGLPNSKNSHYVSKVVSIKDHESDNLKMASRILGSDLSLRYLAALQGECAPADKVHPSSQKNVNSMKSAERAVIAWPKRGQACSELKNKLLKGEDISKESKVMFISKYDATVSGWAEKLQKPYKTVMLNIERAVPKFMEVLQKLYQGPEQLIHIDLHTGNIFVREEPLEFGLADFGRCMFRRQGQDPSHTFYGNFLIDHMSKNEFFCSYSQVPFESRLLNYCYRNKMDNVSPSALVKGWENDNTVKLSSVGSTDIIQANRSNLVSYLLKRVLFIAMVEQIQSICRKIRANSDSLALFKALSVTEKTVVEFILTRYSILSPLNTICEEVMNVFRNEPMFDSSGNGNNTLIKFIMIAIIAPYDQEGSSLAKSLTAIQGADMRVVWADVGM